MSDMRDISETDDESDTYGIGLFNHPLANNGIKTSNKNQL